MSTTKNPAAVFAPSDQRYNRAATEIATALASGFDVTDALNKLADAIRKNPAAVALGRLGGLKKGRKGFAAMSPERREAARLKGLATRRANAAAPTPEPPPPKA